VQLFERDKRRVLPTAAGRQLAEQARDILRKVDVLVETARTFGQPLSGELRLGVIPTVGPYLLPRILGPLRERHPELSLFLREDKTPELVERLQRGELDVLLLALEADLPGCTTETLFSDPFLVALPRGHRLAASPSLSTEALEGEPMLLLEEGHCLRDQALPLCEASGARELRAYRASSLGTLVQMVGSGLGLTLIPELAVPLESRASEGLVVRPLDAGGPARTIVLAWRSSSAREPEYRLLARSIAEAYSRS
jgi:LysR family hydrogen peroxide-inducible transcriptional activator